MQQRQLKAVIAGLWGTLAMTMVILMAPAMGMPPMPVGKMLANFMGIPEFIGWAAHVMIGIVLALIYANVFVTRLPGKPWVRGATFGLIPWLVMQAMLNPMMGAGFFAYNTPAPVLIVLGSMMGHLIFGVVVGAFFGSGLLQSQTAPAHSR